MTHPIVAVIDAAHALGYAVVAFDGRVVVLARSGIKLTIEADVTPELLRELLRPVEGGE